MKYVVFLGNEYLNKLDDSAVLDLPASRLAFTTDSFVVDPIFFPGGDIGRLAVCGTVNDLTMVGARPCYLSVGFIIEEGFRFRDLKRIVHSIKNTVEEAGVLIVTGDTKVVEKGHGDGVFINTSGIGIIPDDHHLSGSNVKVGDRVIINGSIGRHGMAVITSREGFGFQNQIQSDVAPLNLLVQSMFTVTDKIHTLRDATRGGLATVLNEIAKQSNVAIELDEKVIPVQTDVRGACEILGFDPLYVANEGVLVAFVAPDFEHDMIKTMRKNTYGKNSTVIGKVIEEPKQKVILNTEIGSHRIVDLLSGEQLPRIC